MEILVRTRGSERLGIRVGTGVPVTMRSPVGIRVGTGIPARMRGSEGLGSPEDWEAPQPPSRHPKPFWSRESLRGGLLWV